MFVGGCCLLFCLLFLVMFLKWIFVIWWFFKDVGFWDLRLVVMDVWIYILFDVNYWIFYDRNIFSKLLVRLRRLRFFMVLGVLVVVLFMLFFIMLMELVKFFLFLMVFLLIIVWLRYVLILEWYVIISIV